MRRTDTISGQVPHEALPKVTFSMAMAGIGDSSNVIGPASVSSRPVALRASATTTARKAAGSMELSTA